MGQAAARLIAPLALLLAAGCAGPEEGCDGLGGTPHVAVEFLFGLSRPDGGVIRPDEWDRFFADAVAPHGRGGLTVFEARGQWRDRAGRTVHEPSRVVRIVLPRPAVDPAALRAVADAYRARFGQESVGVTTTRTCAAF